MNLEVGDLVCYVQEPQRLAIVTMTHITQSGADVCEVIIVCDKDHPDSIGSKRYLNQDYWKKVSPLPLDDAITRCESEYEEIIGLYDTYGES